MEQIIEKLKELKIEHLKCKNTISSNDFEKIRSECVVFDARSPSEFEDYHIVGAVNLALLEDEARAIIGTIYKQSGSQEAVNKGWEFFEENLDNIISLAKKNVVEGKIIVVYCARGGMRSGIITNLLEFLGYKVYQLIGGIKDYRTCLYKWLDHLLDNWSAQFVVLEGMTGTRKTELIHILDVPKLDLEGLAQHRASTYGGVGLEPRSQKMFLFLLYEELLKLQNVDKIVVEGESKKIGNIYLPNKLFKLMLEGNFIKVVASDDVRIKHIIDEYCTPEGVSELIALTPRLVKYIGKKKVDEVINWFETGDNYSAVKFLLLEYYDKVYKNFAKKYVKEISTDDLLIAKKEVEEVIKKNH